MAAVDDGRGALSGSGLFDVWLYALARGACANAVAKSAASPTSFNAGHLRRRRSRTSATVPAPSRPATKAETQRRDREEARDRLRRIFPEGSRVTVVHVFTSASGMSRRFLVLSTAADGEILDVSRLVVRAGVGQAPRGGKAGVTMTGTGMDMAFALVYELTYALHGVGVETLRHSTIFGA